MLFSASLGLVKLCPQQIELVTHICELLGRFLYALGLVHCDAKLGELVHKACGTFLGLLLDAAQDHRIVNPPTMTPVLIV